MVACQLPLRKRRAARWPADRRTFQVARRHRRFNAPVDRACANRDDAKRQDVAGLKPP
jgi:hypothetical protein